MVESFPGGVIVKGALESQTIDSILKELEKADWVLAKYTRFLDNNEKLIESDINYSSAKVTKKFSLPLNVFDIDSFQNEVGEIISSRFKLFPGRFSSYGFSKYLKGDKLDLHSDTGAYNTNRLITCLLYLKSPKTGGELFFPEVNFQINVEKGMLVCFYSELKHLVKEITDGERIVMVFFAES